MSTIESYFVGIGAQKSGTTWLARMLAAHPDIFITPVKEIHYFDHIAGITEQLSDKKRRSRHRKYHQRMWTQLSRFSEHRSQWSWWRDYMGSPIDDAWYRRLFAHRGGATFAGEITPEYAILGKQGLAHIKRLAPTARVVFIMRNPVDRMWSQVLHQCRSRGLDANRQTTEAIVAMLAEPRFGELGDYAATLDDMKAVFRSDQTLALFYEDMHQDRLAALRQVCGFIGTRFDAAYFPELGRRFNRSQQAALPAPVREHLRVLCRPQAEAVRQRLGRLPESWEKELGELSARKA
ncbi:MAG: sulfotransferase [Hyphomicrobiaceae bacterium]|nr:sulfotransferase [Hyphomicrobiaceae bacterium]